MNDNVLRALQHKQQEIPNLPGDSPNLVNRFTQSDGGKTYKNFANFNGMNNSEGVLMWDDKFLYPAGTHGFTITTSMMNAILYRETANRVAGLCKYDPVSKSYQAIDVPVGKLITDFFLPLGADSYGQKPGFLTTDKKQCTWKTLVGSLLSFEDVGSRYTPNSVFNEPYSALPAPTVTVGTRVRGTCGMTDYWEPEMAGRVGAPLATEASEGDMLQFQLVVKMREEKGTRKKIYYYEFVPTMNSKPKKPLQIARDPERRDVWIHSPPHFVDIAVVHKGKQFNKNNATPRHLLLGEDSATFTEFTSGKVHVRIIISH